jgi:hypothetical protein
MTYKQVVMIAAIDANGYCVSDATHDGVEARTTAILMINFSFRNIGSHRKAWHMITPHINASKVTLIIRTCSQGGRLEGELTP